MAELSTDVNSKTIFNEVFVAADVETNEACLDILFNSLAENKPIIGCANWTGRGYYMFVGVKTGSARGTVFMLKPNEIRSMRRTSESNVVYAVYTGTNA